MGASKLTAITDKPAPRAKKKAKAKKEEKPLEPSFQKVISEDDLDVSDQ